ncbi:putative G protein alpha subunit GNA-3 [Mycena alexandri]|uniref:G protein alpha subunit GNA-3 n=2 Tax=Mycena alexandri TaxID=1745969 RepID=A0AAD6SBH4_9AGAR|nr:putative G protein alpha subunit GNA-3 [Mycena alexandri]
MGQSASKESRSERARSEAIDKQIQSDSKRYKKECKILLLGSGESGKSTIVKQMKIIHQGGFEERERVDYRTTVAGTLASVVRRVGVARMGLQGGGEGRPREGREGGREEDVSAHAAVLLRAFPAVVGRDTNVHLGTANDGYTYNYSDTDTSESGRGEVEVGVDPVPFTRASSSLDAAYTTDSASYNTEYAARGGQTGRISTRPGTPGDSASAARFPSPFAQGQAQQADVLAQTHAVLTPALADAIWHVARAPAVERFVDDHPGEFYLMDSAGYFFSHIHRIASPTYVPSEEDVLRARARSTAIIETRFWMGDLMIHMFDVGGQRSERKKWIHCFESVTSIIFCTALSEYDQVLEEERRVNRMRESLYLFESVINSRWFLRTSVILFLNKIDVFKRKLPKIPLGRYFPEYAGGNDLQKAAKYILWKFMQENRAKLTVYPHVTQATNTKNIRLVFAAVKETILQNALKDSGIL